MTCESFKIRPINAGEIDQRVLIINEAEGAFLVNGKGIQKEKNCLKFSVHTVLLYVCIPICTSFLYPNFVLFSVAQRCLGKTQLYTTE